jgi:mycolipenoyl-CoA---2-(long-chain-fatty acyl)-trehalose mycolipenoyltransferase / long-chain-acyl-CoA---trehalose acyltransferase
MRLTNVARMALPPGRLLSYAVLARAERGRELTVSFDQGRHVGQGQRPGSWMAIAARLPLGTSLEDVAAAWCAVVQRHGALRTAFSYDLAGTLRLHEIDLAPGAWVEHRVASGQEPREVLRGLFDAACAPFEQPSHRLALLLPDATQSDRRPMVIVGSDHAHVDMWSFLVVLRDLDSCLGDLRQGREPGAALPAAASFAEHSAALATRPPAPVEVHQRWQAILAAEGGVMPVFPLPLGDPGFAGDSLVEVRDLLAGEASARFEAIALARGVRMFALATAVMTAVTAELAGVPLRAVLPVHSRDSERWRDSVGWYITNAVIESSDPDPVVCARAVKEAIALGSYPLAPILAPYGGMPIAPGMFAISWLDTRRLPAPASDAEVQYVSAVVRDDGVMVWFIANETGLHLRARFPDTAEARASVGAWLDGVEAGLQNVVTPGV